MKRIICLFVSLIMCFSFVACGGKSKTQPVGTDVSYYAKLGKIPECEYKLSDDSDEIIGELKSKAEAHNEDDDDTHERHTDFYYNVYEGGESTCIATSGVNYYFSNENKSEGINRIVSFGKSYGFDTGTLSIEVKNSLSSYGFDTSERAITSDEALLVSGSPDSTCLEYSFGDKTVVFIFFENSLFAVMLYK